MKHKLTILFLLLSILIEDIFLAFWLLHCKDFQEILHVHFGPLALQIKGETGQDYGLPFFIIRFFHNKPVDGSLLIIKTYFKFWDFVLFGELLPFLGSFGVLTAGYYFFASKTKRTLHWIVFLLFLIIPFLELFLSSSVPFIIRVGLFYAFFASVSTIGLWKFLLSEKWAFVILTILAIVSIWWLLVADFHLATFCYQYPL